MHDLDRLGSFYILFIYVQDPLGWGGRHHVAARLGQSLRGRNAGQGGGPSTQQQRGGPGWSIPQWG